MRWEILSKPKFKNEEQIVKALLKNRNIKNENDFFEPADPTKITLKTLEISEIQIKKAIDRIKKAKKNGEHAIIYGDYDADGITGTATMWETLNSVGVNVLPHIPDRFSEGYGLNLESVKKLKNEDPKLSLIITVDHGITAGDKVKKLESLGIDMIITDHHQMGSVKPKPLALIYTTKIGGSALAWVFAREILKKVGPLQQRSDLINEAKKRLELAAIGTIADQLPLTGPNRSIVKHGLVALNNTKRPGLKALQKEAGIKNEIGTYEVGFLIAPRINSMGRLKHGIESLRLLCTGIPSKAKDLAIHIGRTNSDRQKIVEEVVDHARKYFEGIKEQSVIVLADEKYHEGVIGLAAARLVEEFYRPAIVLSKKGNVAKASARSIPGFNIIENIRKLESLYIEGGGHPMAAGFSIKVEKISEFTRQINKIAKPILTPEILSKKIKVDMEMDFSHLTMKLLHELQKFAPTGIGNPEPSFLSTGVEILDARTVGREAKHIKLKLKQDGQVFDSIYFGGGKIYSDLTPDSKIDIVYRLEENVWNDKRSLQLVIKDLRVH